jgi:hypothetical protein
MRHKNGTPENRRRRLHAAIYRPYTRGSTMLVVVLVGLLAAIVVGPDRAIDWLGAYLIPMVVITGVVIAAVALLLYASKKLPDSPLRDWWR